MVSRGVRGVGDFERKRQCVHGCVAVEHTVQHLCLVSMLLEPAVSSTIRFRNTVVGLTLLQACRWSLLSHPPLGITSTTSQQRAAAESMRCDIYW
jgi:hypothetical protein